MIVHEKQSKSVFAYCPSCWIHTYHVDEPGGRRCLNCQTLRDIKNNYPVKKSAQNTNQLPQSQ
jgi:hypothetical protein